MCLVKEDKNQINFFHCGLEWTKAHSVRMCGATRLPGQGKLSSITEGPHLGLYRFLSCDLRWQGVVAHLPFQNLLPGSTTKARYVASLVLKHPELTLQGKQEQIFSTII